MCVVFFCFCLFFSVYILLQLHRNNIVGSSSVAITPGISRLPYDFTVRTSRSGAMCQWRGKFWGEKLTFCGAWRGWAHISWAERVVSVHGSWSGALCLCCGSTHSCRDRPEQRATDVPSTGCEPQCLSTDGFWEWWEWCCRSLGPERHTERCHWGGL